MCAQKHRVAHAHIAIYTDLAARTGEREFFNNLAYNIGSKVDLECTI